MKLTEHLQMIMQTHAFKVYVQKQFEQFKKQNGFGKWLAEYKRMEVSSLFEPSSIIKQYQQILNGKYEYGFICMQAINYICVNAIDSFSNILQNNDFCIMLNNTEIALDDDKEELIGLSFDEAISICKAMNEDIGNKIFFVYLNNTLID